MFLNTLETEDRELFRIISYITNNIVIFTSHATLGADDFTQKVLSMKNTKKNLIVDEVHNIGEASSKKTLLEE